MRYFLQGVAVALASIAPIGMQNLFVINSALAFPRCQALIAATLVFLFDMSLTLSAFFGMGALIQGSPTLRKIVLGAGSLIVLRIGLGLVLAQGHEPTREKSLFSLKKIVSAAFAVTWFNPQALVDTTLFFGAFRASLPAGAVPLFIGGCLCASPLWFVSITLAVSAFSVRIKAKFLRALNAVCGSVIIFYGARLLWDFVQLMRGGC